MLGLPTNGLEEAVGDSIPVKDAHAFSIAVLSALFTPISTNCGSVNNMSCSTPFIEFFSNRPRKADNWCFLSHSESSVTFSRCSAISLCSGVPYTFVASSYAVWPSSPLIEKLGHARNNVSTISDLPNLKR